MPKRRRLAAPAPVDDAVAIPTPVDDAVAGFNIVAALMDAELPFYDLVLHLPAKDSARLAQTDRRSRQLLMDPATARWCAESRRSLLASRNVPGDLPLAPINCDWSLERLHLCEHPPRFPHVYFRFADDGLDKREATKVERVAALLRRHPRLRIRIHGYAQPEAPSSIGEALAQARATSVRQLLLTLLQGEASWEDEDANEGVRSDRDDAVWLAPGFAHTQVVGNRLQATGRWPHTPENRNFEGAPPAASSSSSIQSIHDGDYHRLRRAEFTVIGLA